jgi:hypothetical protein
VPVTVSIGVAALDAGSSRELSELMAAADAALYRAKASGRDQVQMISTSRGLSAVRPPAREDDESDKEQTTTIPNVATDSPIDSTPADENAADENAGDENAGDENAAQASDAGNSSTATTSAVPV